MGNRRKARELALRVLFETDFTSSRVDEVLARLVTDEKMEPEAAAFLADLVRTFSCHATQLDQLIEALSDNWKLGRMASVDRNLLRLGTCEILHFPDIPKSVSINEYLEIAKKYGTEDSSSFINGILDKVMKPSSNEKLP